MAKGAAADGDEHDRSINEEGYAKLDNLSTGANRESPFLNFSRRWLSELLIMFEKI